MVVFLVLACAHSDGKNGTEQIEDLTTSYFVYNGHIMPPFAYDRLQFRIKRVIDTIDDPPLWLTLAIKDLPELLRSSFCGVMRLRRLLTVDTCVESSSGNVPLTNLEEGP